MTKSKREEAGQIVIRPPAGMRDRIKAAAEANNRSMNAEIVATLEEKYPAPASPEAQKWLDLEDQIQAKRSKLDELWELSNATKGTPEWHEVADEYLRISREMDQLNQQQDLLTGLDAVEMIEKYFREMATRRD
ncbi:Arc family DNA-binding protein [Gemmobacter nectariphilus]|uniref:Arc family DNA-binding protein n=1 Tax=Gemmobacter nectariphilus TaxID=220343 RepID=UPI00041D07B4|nr:Arc family DNA-binding protein [Gemmobacter nectariphilus]